MGYTGSGRQQLPAVLETAVIKWADASADLAAVLRQIDYKQTPPLLLVSCGPRQHCRRPAWRTWFRGVAWKTLRWELRIAAVITLHPGAVWP